MKEEPLQNQIAWATQVDAVRTGECPPDETLAAFLDGRLPATDRPALESHLADCGRCLALVGETARAERTGVVHQPSRWRHVGRALMATAAAAVLTVTVLLSIRGPDDTDGDVTAVRFSQHAPEVPELSFPAGSEVPLAELEIDWTEVPDHLFYELRIVDEDGDLIWQERVTEPRWKPSAAAPLKAGVDYFARVDAYLPDGKPVVSHHVPFRVTDGER